MLETQNRTTSVSNNGDIKDEKLAVKKKLQDLQREERHYDKKLKELDLELEKTKKLQAEQNQDKSLLLLHSQVEEKKDQIRSLETEITKSRKQIEDLKKQTDNEETGHENLQDQIRSLDSQIVEMEGEKKMKEIEYDQKAESFRLY